MKTTQIKLIKAYLEKGKSITQLKALKKFQCFRLSARIFDIKKLGLDIITDKISKNGKTFASYRLNNENIHI